MISSSIHADMPAEFPEEYAHRVLLLHGHLVVTVLLAPGVHLGLREPVSGLTLSAASVSGIDAEAMSGVFAFAGSAGAGAAFGPICGRWHNEHPFPARTARTDDRGAAVDREYQRWAPEPFA